MLDLITLAQAGPVAILLVGIVVLTRAFLTGAVWPGWVGRQEREGRLRAEAQVVELLKLVPPLAKMAANGSEPGASGG